MIIRIIVRFIGETTDFFSVGREYLDECVSSGKGCILALWHGRTLLPIYHHRDMGIWAITSLSNDGEIQTKVVEGFGYQTIRGSTGKDGVRAALTACKKLSGGGILAITPDGPRGPSYEIQEGTAFIACRSRLPIIPVGVGLGKRIITKAWDKYAIPLPFGKCALVYGKPIYPPPNRSGKEIESTSIALKTAIDDMQKMAEQIAGEGAY